MAREKNIAHDRLNDSERSLWIMNDEGLYNWWKSSRQPIRKFMSENRSDIDDAIRRALAPPPQKTWRDYNPRKRKNGSKTDAALGAGTGSLIGGTIGGLTAGPIAAYGGSIVGGMLGTGLFGKKPSGKARVSATVGAALLGPIGAGVGAALGTDSSRGSNMKRLANHLKRYT
jgi:hypothetical protein